MTFTKESNRIYCAQGGKTLAEVTFPQAEPGVVVIDHTWVDPSLRGQGAAGQLMQAVVDALRADGRKARASCSYARAWFARHPEAADILAEGRCDGTAVGVHLYERRVGLEKID